MILSHIIQRVLSTINAGVQSDDNRARPRHIYNKILTVRSLLLNQKANKRQHLSDVVFQTLPCVEMIKAPIHECPCLPPVGCYFVKTKYPLPDFVTDLSGPLIQLVSSLDGSITYTKTSWKAKKYKTGNKYTSKNPNYYFKDKHLYLTCDTTTKIVSIVGVFKDPLEAYNYPSFCDEDCIDCTDCESILDKEFPIDPSLEEPLVTMVSEELFKVFNGIPADNRNDSSDEKKEA